LAPTTKISLLVVPWLLLMSFLSWCSKCSNFHIPGGEFCRHSDAQVKIGWRVQVIQVRV